MSEELQQKLRSQLWTVANTLRGNMSASDFMYFTLGFIFYKYLSEKIELYANEELKEDGMGERRRRVEGRPERGVRAGFGLFRRAGIPLFYHYFDDRP